MNEVDVRDKARSLPLKPGVYLMLDKSGDVIYVGKAKALRNRVSSYFAPNAAHTAKTRRMVAQVADFDTIIAASEFEALVLECSLIKRHQPKYNILLKDSKGYPFIRLSTRDEYPRFTVSHQIEDGYRYFGPYGGRGLSFQVIKALSAAMRLPACGREFPKDIGKGRPCLQYHINRCAGVCAGKVTKEEYAELVRQAVMLLEGRQQGLVSELTSEMEAAAGELLFEKAAHVRDRLLAISALGRRQIVIGGGMADTDVIACHEGETRTGIAVLHFMEGNLIGRDMELLSEQAPAGEALAAFLPQYYLARRRCPKMICLSHEIEDRELVEQLLFEKLGGKTKIIIPKKGDKVHLVEMADANAREEIERLTSREEKLRKVLSDLQKLLGLSKPPQRIEAVDISNTGKADNVGVMTCFVDGKPLKKAYRQFIIKQSEGQDDYHSMQEVLSRRFKRLDEKKEGFAEPPDLLLVDGGAAHAAMAARLVADFGRDIPVYGMVKDDRHRTRGLMSPDGLEVSMEATPALFAFVGQIQEETHRSALAFHKKRRSMFLTELEKIPGVGEARRNKLIASFKSLKAIEEASLEELCGILPKDAAGAVYMHFRGYAGDNPGAAEGARKQGEIEK